MSVSGIITTVSYTGDGSTTDFAVTFPFQGSGSNSELTVVERNISTGVETTKTYTTHYTVTGGNGATGTVIAGTAPASSVQWHFRRNTTTTQTTDYVTNDPFAADTIEGDFDRLAMSGQERDSDIGQAFKYPDTYTGGASATMPEPVAGAYLLYNAAGDALETSTSSAAQYLGGNGTVLLPFYSFSSDPNTGIFRIGADNLGFSVNGVKGLDLSTTGLAVTGTLSATAITGSGILSVDATTESTSGTTGSIHTDGGVGIAKKLHVIGTTTHGGNVVSDTDSTDDLGTTGVRWANLFVDDITATTAITAAGVITGLTLEATGDTAAGDNSALGYTSGEGAILTGQGSATDVTIKNDADATVISVPTGTTNTTFGGTIASDTDSTDDIGTTGVRWKELFVDDITMGGDQTIGGNLTVTGNLTINGSTVTNDAVNLLVKDPLIEINSGASSNANDLGVLAERGSTGNNVFWGWDESADRFVAGLTTAIGSSTGNISFSAMAEVEFGNIVATGATFSGTSSNLGTITTADINGGTLDGAVIGGASAAAITGTTLTANTSITLATGGAMTGVLDSDTMTGATAALLSTSESIKAYVDNTSKAAGISMTWETTTTDTDQGVGKVWANNSTLSSATVLYFDDVERNSVSINALIDSLDNPTASNSATIYIQEAGSATAGVLFLVSGAVISASTYSKVAVTHQATFGTLSDGDVVGVTFAFSGDDGEDGAGSGTVTQINAGDGFSFSAITTTGTIAVDGVLQDLDALGAPSSDGQFIVATGSGAFNYESGATAFTSIKQAATTSATGVAELATTAETVTGTDTARVVTPAGLHGALAGLTDTTITAADTVIFADATDSNALKEDTVQGILDLAGGGGAWTLIGTSVASSSASLTITGLDSTYDTYAIALADLVPATDNVRPWLRVGDSSGIDSGTNDYSNLQQGFRSGSADYRAVGHQNISYIFLPCQYESVGNASGEGFGGLLHLHRPGDGTMRPMLTGITAAFDTDTNLGGGIMYAQRTAVITLDRIQFLFNTGNIASGRMTVWGIAHA